jgi:HK97 family phage prohead protease
VEYKHLPQFIKDISGRQVVGIFAVHGNIDEGGDRSWPGSFANVAVNGRTRARFVWQHRTDEPPIAAITSIREVDRTGLPSAVLGYAPDATGGVEVTRAYLDTPRGSEVLAGIQAGAIDEMSYAYDATRFDFEAVEGKGQVRNIREVKLYDISDVLWGMNPATVGSKVLPLEDEHQAALAAVDGYMTRLRALHSLRAKEGRTLSDVNRKRISGAIEAMSAAIGDLKELLAATEPKSFRDTHMLRAEWERTRARLRQLGVPT